MIYSKNAIFSIEHDRNTKIYKIKQNILNKNIKNLAAHSYIDLTQTIDAEKLLLIGNRINDNDDIDIMSLYLLLTNMYYNQYAIKYMFGDDNGGYHYEHDIESMAKCISLNVINFLYKKQNNKQYKIKCMISNNNNYNHYDKTLSLIPQREWIIRRSINVGGKCQDIHYYCDMCLCLQGDYYFMYHCKKSIKSKYDGPDICITCIYNQVNKYNQLRLLLIK